MMRHFDPTPVGEWNRAWAMSAAWDEAYDALAKRDLPAFDKAMSLFRELQFPRETADEPNKRAVQA